MTKDAWVVALLSAVPKNRFSRAMGWLARRTVSRLFIRQFIRFYKIDLSEAIVPVNGFDSLDALFTRALLPNARAVCTTPDTLTSPVDGKVAFVGTSQGGVVDMLPNQRFGLEALTGLTRDDDCDVIVLYLAPPDYHRVHSPVTGTLKRLVYRPGTLWPVFSGALSRVKNLYCGNERTTLRIASDAGDIDVVMVGAYGVGRMELVHSDTVTNQHSRAEPTEKACHHEVSAGELVGLFHLGSTVVVCVPRGVAAFTARPGDCVKMGNAIGTLAKS